MKQLGAAFLQYSQDYDHRAPCLISHGQQWPCALAPYVEGKVWQCPSFPRSQGDSATLASTYGANPDVINSIDGKPGPICLFSLGPPGSLLLLADSQDAKTEFLGEHRCSVSAAGLLSLYDPHRKPAVTSPCDSYLSRTGGIDFRHLDKANILFLDGHIRSFRKERVLPGQDNSQKISIRWDRSG